MSARKRVEREKAKAEFAKLSPDERALMQVIDKACRRSPDGKCQMSDLELGQAAGFTGESFSIRLRVRRLLYGYTTLEDGSIVDHDEDGRPLPWVTPMQ
jgi:hypothetical protein